MDHGKVRIFRALLENVEMSPGEAEVEWRKF